jgi:xanthine dehydrogenase YagR molybdenum-binding subunit
MRAPGEAIGSFAVESAIDELAHNMAIGPAELRLRNVPERHPTMGAPCSQHALDQARRDCMKRFGWDQRSAKPGLRRDGEWLIGMGCATGCFPYARMPGANIRLTLRRDSSATPSCSAQEMGMGTATVQTQHAADRLGLPVNAITFELGDSSLPAAPFAGGSSQTASLAGAVVAAADKLAGELLRLAGNDSPLAGLRVGQVRLAEGSVVSINNPVRCERYGSILSRAAREEVTVAATGSPPMEFLTFAIHSTLAVFCELRVSTVTGEVRVNRLLGSSDCGAILNPKTATRQFKGGIIMGLGLALTEETLFDERNGRIMNASLADYHLPTHLDVPAIDVIWTGIPDPRTRSAHGVSARSASPVSRLPLPTLSSMQQASGSATYRSHSTSCGDLRPLSSRWPRTARRHGRHQAGSGRTAGDRSAPRRSSPSPDRSAWRRRSGRQTKPLDAAPLSTSAGPGGATPRATAARLAKPPWLGLAGSGMATLETASGQRRR